MKWLRRILTVVFTALLLFSAYKIYEYVREARESEASVETLIEKAVEERTPKEPGSLCAFFSRSITINLDRKAGLAARLSCPNLL